MMIEEQAVEIRAAIERGTTALGIEFGSTRIKAVLTGADTKTAQFIKELRWNNAYYRLALGF